MTPHVELQEVTDIITNQDTVAEPMTPTTYGELEWAGLFPRLDVTRVEQQQQTGTPNVQFDFPPARSADSASEAQAMSDLDDYLVLTYYYLYPMTEFLPNPQGQTAPSVLRREGQWEAVSLYFKGNPDSDFNKADPDGRPSFPEQSGCLGQPTPMYAVYSGGLRHSDQYPSPAECRPWSQVSAPLVKPVPQPNRPLPGPPPPPAVFVVTSGSHKNLFEQRAEVHDTRDSQPSPDELAVSQIIAQVAGVIAAACTATGPYNSVGHRDPDRPDCLGG
jgi:hypothetical protein